ncbi:hypothetical protein E4K08_02390 (plasmid) [Raoultella ornithinolytica]|uniref:hypothetical protein n=1 Tax=Raoultella ornithinolytica TaxID=54291 RepID=UPI0010BE30B2|nr:hypothetical protein [Raoultella ornithinolytica]QCK75568.1 hypothetical protein E4K08_02390 [Raoultella ornithinolytica]
MTTSTTAKSTAKSNATAATRAKSSTTARTSRPAANKIDKDSILMAHAKAFYGEEIPPSNTGSDISKLEKGSDNDKTYVWYMTESVSRVIELKALEESSKLKHLVGCERSVIYGVNVGDAFIKEIDLDEAEQLLEEFPDIPREKNLEDFLSSLDKKFVELNISSIITSENLNFGKEKLIKLGAVKVGQWLEMVLDEVHVFYKRQHFIETVESPHQDLNNLYGKLKPLMQEFGLKDKHYDLSFKEMMIHKVNGFDFVVADLMPRLLKLEASLKDDELKARAAMEKNQDNEVMIEAKKDDLKDSGKLYDVTVSRVLKGSACALIAYGISVSLYNFFSYSGFF